MRQRLMKWLIWFVGRLYVKGIIGVDDTCSFARWYEKEFDKI